MAYITPDDYTDRLGVFIFITNCQMLLIPVLAIIVAAAIHYNISGIDTGYKNNNYE